MKISIITPCYNSERFIEETILSIVEAKKRAPCEVEYIVVDGGSTDGTMRIVNCHKGDIEIVVSERDRGPADAINKGFKLATGDYVGWLNGDDLYKPDAIERLVKVIERHPDRALYFGKCDIVNEDGREIRKAITIFKNCFFPFACRPLIQTINFVSQPSSFFSAGAVREAGEIRLDMKAAFDYEFILRLWKIGGAKRIPGGVVSSFRWYPTSISGANYHRQFKEEFDAAASDAGRYSPQVLLHYVVQKAIVYIYERMAKKR